MKSVEEFDPGPEPPRRKTLERIKALGGSAQGLRTQVEAQARLDGLEPKPPVVVTDGGKVVREATVRLSADDLNLRHDRDWVKPGPEYRPTVEISRVSNSLVKMSWSYCRPEPTEDNVVSEYNPFGKDRLP